MSRYSIVLVVPVLLVGLTVLATLREAPLSLHRAMPVATVGELFQQP